VALGLAVGTERQKTLACSTHAYELILHGVRRPPAEHPRGPCCERLSPPRSLHQNGYRCDAWRPPNPCAPRAVGMNERAKIQKEGAYHGAKGQC